MGWGGPGLGSAAAGRGRKAGAAVQLSSHNGRGLRRSEGGAEGGKAGGAGKGGEAGGEGGEGKGVCVCVCVEGGGKRRSTSKVGACWVHGGCMEGAW